jgi:hypothetical protein
MRSTGQSFTWGLSRSADGRWLCLAPALARLGTIVVADADHLARLEQNEDQPVLQRLGRLRLAQHLVHTELHGLDNTPALTVSGQEDDRNVRHRQHAGRAHNTHKFGAGEERHFLVEDDHVRGHGTDCLQRGNAVGALVNRLHARWASMPRTSLRINAFSSTTSTLSWLIRTSACLRLTPTTRPTGPHRRDQ